MLAYHGVFWQLPQFDNTPVDLSLATKLLKVKWKHAREVLEDMKEKEGDKRKVECVTQPRYGIGGLRPHCK